MSQALRSIGLVLLLAAAGCSGGRTMPDSLVLFFTRDTRGNIEPCGCTQNQFGGLPRRASALDREAAWPTMLIDVGNATRGTREWDKLKLRYILAGMKAMGYSAMNVGRREVGFSGKELADLSASSGVPFVSANVVEAATLRPVVAPYVVEEIEGLRVAITGVVPKETEGVAAGLAVLDPEQALLKLLPDLSAKSDMIVLAADVDMDGMKRLASRFYEVDVILGGDVRESTERPERVNGVLIAAVAEKGKTLGRVDLHLDREGKVKDGDGKAIQLDEALPDAPDMVSIIARMKEEQKSKELSDAATHEDLEPIAGAASVAGASRYAGAAECRECHEKEHGRWQGSVHAGARETLAARGYAYDRDCLECHVVGLGARDGYRSEKLTPHLTGVQCESCHGPGGGHVDLYRSKKGEKSDAKALVSAAQGACVRCHTKERSPQFTYDAYWPKIRH